MAERVERTTETRVSNDNPVVVEKRSDYPVLKAAQIVWFIVGVIVFLLLLRFILSLLGANPENAFADLIYTLSYPFVAPFRGLLRVGEVELGIARFELETLVAAFIYALIGWGIVKLISLGRREVAA